MCLNLPWHQSFLKSNIYKEKLVGLWFLKKSPNCLPTACWGFSCWFASASACPVCLLWENACEVHLHVLKLNHCKVCTCQNPCNKNQSVFSDSSAVTLCVQHSVVNPFFTDALWQCWFSFPSLPSCFRISFHGFLGAALMSKHVPMEELFQVLSPSRLV